MALDLRRFDALTFDCYGTLIDWETGLLAALRAALPGSTRGDDELLEEYARHEAAAERGPYLPYREVLAAGLRGVAAREGVEPGEEAVARFSESVRDWPAFPDSAEALAALHRRFRLGVITNCDTDLFAASQDRLGVAFDWVVTAEEARAYKPSRRALRARVHEDRRPPRADPPRRAEPVPRPRACARARACERLDRPAERAVGVRRHATGRGSAGCDVHEPRRVCRRGGARVT